MKPRITDDIKKDLRGTIEEIIRRLNRRDLRREEIIRRSREIIRCSGRLTAQIVSEGYSDVNDILNRLRECEKNVIELLNYYEEDPDLVRGGVSLQAFIEFCEASYLAHILYGSESLCNLNKKMPEEAIILGILDATGELKRMAINALGRFDIDDAEDMLNLMREIYNILSGTDYPDPLVPGYKHKIDVLRRNIEDLEALLSDMKTRKRIIDLFYEKSDLDNFSNT